MKCSPRLSVAAVAFLSVVALASHEGSAQSQPQSGATATTQQNRPTSGEAVTLVGCVQRESDYRKAQDAGRGGVAGTGIGAGNEFVLTSASMSTGGGAAAAGSVGTAGDRKSVV